MQSQSIVNTILKVTFAVALLVLYYLHFTSQTSLVYVDSPKILAGYKGMDAAMKEYQGKVKGWTANIDTLRSEIIALDRSLSALSGVKRDMVAESVKNKKAEFMNYEQAIKDKIYEEDKKLTAQVTERVNDYLKRYGEKNGYTVIFAATQYGNIAYVKDGLDVTDEVLKGLNAEYTN